MGIRLDPQAARAGLGLEHGAVDQASKKEAIAEKRRAHKKGEHMKKASGGRKPPGGYVGLEQSKEGIRNTNHR